MYRFQTDSQITPFHFALGHELFIDKAGFIRGQRDAADGTNYTSTGKRTDKSHTRNNSDESNARSDTNESNTRDDSEHIHAADDSDAANDAEHRHSEHDTGARKYESTAATANPTDDATEHHTWVNASTYHLVT